MACGLNRRTGCLLALLLLSPVWTTIAVAITLLSGESPLIAVLRTGRFGSPLWLLKFRTMWSGFQHSPWRLYYGEDAAEVLSVSPGITGLWQVNGRNSLSYEERRRLDVELVRSLTPKLYLRILLRNTPVVLTGKNSW